MSRGRAAHTAPRSARPPRLWLRLRLRLPAPSARPARGHGPRRCRAAPFRARSPVGRPGDWGRGSGSLPEPLRALHPASCPAATSVRCPASCLLRSSASSPARQPRPASAWSPRWAAGGWDVLLVCSWPGTAFSVSLQCLAVRFGVIHYHCLWLLAPDVHTGFSIFCLVSSFLFPSSFFFSSSTNVPVQRRHKASQCFEAMSIHLKQAFRH